jgi:hypothetical protein
MEGNLIKFVRETTPGATPSFPCKAFAQRHGHGRSHRLAGEVGELSRQAIRFLIFDMQMHPLSPAVEVFFVSTIVRICASNDHANTGTPPLQDAEAVHGQCEYPWGLHIDLQSRIGSNIVGIIEHKGGKPGAGIDENHGPP